MPQNRPHRPTASRPVRPLLLCLIALIVSGCALTAESAPRGVGPRWVILGDSTIAPRAELLAALLATLPPEIGRPSITDLATPGAALETVVRTQLPARLAGAADLTIIMVGMAELDTPEPPTAEWLAGYLSALIATIRGHDPAPVLLVGPPFQNAATGADRLTVARGWRRTDQYQRALRTAAQRQSAALVEHDPTLSRWADGAELSAWRQGLSEALRLRQHVGIVQPAGPLDPAAWVSGLDRNAAQRLRGRASSALASGHRLDVLAKVGDSITASPAFLAPLSTAAADLGAYRDLAPAIDFFTRVPVPAGLDDQLAAGLSAGEASWLDLSPVVSDRTEPPPDAESEQATSFTRRSIAARARWAAADVLAGGNRSALGLELSDLRPGVAVVMFGTNDLTRATLEDFEAAMARLLEGLEREGVIALLTTLPDRLDRAEFGRLVPEFNAAIRALARAYDVPLIDYGGPLAFLPDGGLADGLHPSVCPAGAGSFTPTCLRHGYNVRNLLTLHALDLLRRNVLEPIQAPLTRRAPTP